jgi:hypothetical protein
MQAHNHLDKRNKRALAAPTVLFPRYLLLPLVACPAITVRPIIAMTIHNMAVLSWPARVIIITSNTSSALPHNRLYVCKSRQILGIIYFLLALAKSISY